jgi:pantoate kinase
VLEVWGLFLEAAGIVNAAFSKCPARARILQEDRTSRKGEKVMEIARANGMTDVIECYVCGKELRENRHDNFMCLDGRIYRLCVDDKIILSMALSAINQVKALKALEKKIQETGKKVRKGVRRSV